MAIASIPFTGTLGTSAVMADEQPQELIGVSGVVLPSWNIGQLGAVRKLGMFIDYSADGIGTFKVQWRAREEGASLLDSGPIDFWTVIPTVAGASQAWMFHTWDGFKIVTAGAVLEMPFMFDAPYLNFEFVGNTAGVTIDFTTQVFLELV